MMSEERRLYVTGSIQTQDQDENHRPELAAMIDAVRKRAYEIFQRRGEQSGHGLQDWLQAEKEVLGSSVTAVAESTAGEGVLKIVSPRCEPVDLEC